MRTAQSKFQQAVKKVYFCGSMKGGREDAAIYETVMRTIRDKALLLTEHVSDPSLDEGLSQREIFRRDMELLQQCDLVVAECTVPSTGVGYELAAADRLGKPVLVLFRQDAGRELSPMVEGNPNFSVVKYWEENLHGILAGILEPML